MALYHHQVAGLCTATKKDRIEEQLKHVREERQWFPKDLSFDNLDSALNKK